MNHFGLHVTTKQTNHVPKKVTLGGPRVLNKVRTPTPTWGYNQRPVTLDQLARLAQCYRGLKY